MYIAFKKCENNFLEKCIKFFTKSEFVHCELVSCLSNDRFYGYSAFPGEGVRAKYVNYDKDKWEFINLKNLKTQDVKNFYEKTKGLKYDYLGVLGFVFGNPDNPKKYFCSEWCATVLGLNNPSKISPGWLYKYIKGLI